MVNSDAQAGPLASTGHGHAQTTRPDRGAASAPLPSECLLCGRREIAISHNGAIYRLRATRLGKLILTK